MRSKIEKKASCDFEQQSRATSYFELHQEKPARLQPPFCALSSSAFVSAAPFGAFVCPILMLRTTMRLVLLIFTVLRSSHTFQMSFGKVSRGENSKLNWTRLAATTPADAVSSSTETRNERGSFEAFDYNSCWYPVVWVEDLPLNKPTKVTVFDVDYALARTSEYEVMALVDKCPHKAAALSEGRITSAGYFQCAYHGWSFDGKDGTCVEIPQVVAASKDGIMPHVSSSRRECATAVPAMISQGMVWLFPGGSLEKALLAPPPPTIPEIDQPGYTMGTNIRDFPVDWSILLENILDPDHGAFAHGALGFDLYSASTDVPQSVEEEVTNDGKGWKITSRVLAVEKILRFDKLRRGRKVKNVDDPSKIKVGTATFTAPCHVVMGRRDKEKGDSTFLIAFWVTPTGTGRSRFMSANIAKAPFGIPRWINHVVINNFLDQDTFLLATQQRPVLLAEATAHKDTVESGSQPKQSLSVRKQIFAYRSPAEKLQTRLGTFWDETLSRAPNRVSTLLALDRSNALQQAPRREVVLDREEQHLRICPDSQAVVKNCDRIRRTSLLMTLSMIATKLWTVAFSESLSAGVVDRLNSILSPKPVSWVLAVTAVAYWLASKLRREFFFKYTNALRDRDLQNIPKVWMDCKQ
jgi:phenylpropionate dioxygenase-like ring-hydroxylating dioxygenase large terminal subunit